MLDRQIPDGPWRAALTLRSGLLEKTTKATLTFPAGEGRIEATVPATGGFAWWLVILGGALVSLGALFLLLLILRRRNEKDAAEPPVPTLV